MERLPSGEPDPSSIINAIQTAQLLLQASQDLPTPLHPPVERPGFRVHWRSVSAAEHKQIYIGLAEPEPTDNGGQLHLPHIVLVQRLPEIAAPEQYYFFNYWVRRPKPAARETGFVHPVLTPESWQAMQSLLDTTQNELRRQGKLA